MTNVKGSFPRVILYVTETYKLRYYYRAGWSQSAVSYMRYGSFVRQVRPSVRPSVRLSVCLCLSHICSESKRLMHDSYHETVFTSPF